MYFVVIGKMSVLHRIIVVLSLLNAGVLLADKYGLLYKNSYMNTYCLLHEFRSYCIWAPDMIDSKLNTSSCDKNSSINFLTLKNENVTTDDLINWLVPFDTIEEYAEYLLGSSSIVNDNSSICKCKRHHFGSACEYYFVTNSSTIKLLIVTQQKEMSLDLEELSTSFVDEIECKMTDHVLQWHHICDGVVNCQNAVDELNCHLLEFNECDVDEVQCRNGMCIPKEFLFDGTMDCLDSSDEQEKTSKAERNKKCSISSSIECDEYICHSNELPCGDGQCMKWTHLVDHGFHCGTSQNLEYLCDIVIDMADQRNKFYHICKQRSPPLTPLSNASSCLLTLRHAILSYLNKKSNIQGKLISENIIERCPDLIQYPETSVILSVVSMFYNKSRIVHFFQSKQYLIQKFPRNPHNVCLNGSMICNGIPMTLLKSHCISYEEFLLLKSAAFSPIPTIFCEIAAQQMNLTR
jgi:hypothetical protein